MNRLRKAQITMINTICGFKIHRNQHCLAVNAYSKGECLASCKFHARAWLKYSLVAYTQVLRLNAETNRKCARQPITPIHKAKHLERITA